MIKYKINGFTLIEMITVILIIGIISAYTIPKLINLNSFMTSIFFKQVVNSLIYAQDLAIGSGCHIAVDLTTDTVLLKSRINCKTGDFAINIKDPIAKKNSYIQYAPANTNIVTNNFPIYFDHNGQVKLISTNQITMASLTITGNDLQKTININGENGAIY